MKDAIGSKPFLAPELRVNSTAFQTRTCRTHSPVGQLYHKLLTSLDACGEDQVELEPGARLLHFLFRRAVSLKIRDPLGGANPDSLRLHHH